MNNDKIFTDEQSQKFEVRRIENFTYPVIFSDIGAVGTAGATQAFSIQIDNEAIFLPKQMAQFSTVDGAEGFQTPTTLVIPNMLIELTSNDTGHRWMQQPSHLANLTGNGSLPALLNGNRYFAKNSTLEIKIYNIGSDIISRLEIDFIGVKLYLGNPLRRA